MVQSWNNIQNKKLWAISPMPLLPVVTEKKKISLHRGFILRVCTCWEIKRNPGLEPSAHPLRKDEALNALVSLSPCKPQRQWDHNTPRSPSHASSRSTLGAAFLTYMYERLSHQAFYRTGFWNSLWRAVSWGDKASIWGAERVIQIKALALAWRCAGSRAAAPHP